MDAPVNGQKYIEKSFDSLDLADATTLFIDIDDINVEKCI